jgi:hypothetical protein
LSSELALGAETLIFASEYECVQTALKC